jgi:hypothetical protein
MVTILDMQTQSKMLYQFLHWLAFGPLPRIKLENGQQQQVP